MDKSTIKCIDNFLPENIFEDLCDVIPKQIPWTYNAESVDDNDGCRQFTHQFYQEYQPQSDFMDDLIPVCRSIKDLIAPIRVKVNLTPHSHKPSIPPFHHDITEVHKNEFGQYEPTPRIKICVFHVNTNSGYTVVKDENGMLHKFNSKANRAIFFPNALEHTGKNCNVHDRIILNIVYV